VIALTRLGRIKQRKAMENKVLFSFGGNWRRPVTGLPGPDQTKLHSTWFDPVRASTLVPLVQIMSRFVQSAGVTNQKLCNILLGPFFPHNESVVYIYVHIMLVTLKTTQRRELWSYSFLANWPATYDGTAQAYNVVSGEFT